LAREATGDNVPSSATWIEGSDIVMQFNVWEVPSQDGALEFSKLDCMGGANTKPSGCETKPANPFEQSEVGEHCPSSRGNKHSGRYQNCVPFLNRTV
jgi:hypothetical protein